MFGIDSILFATQMGKGDGWRIAHISFEKPGIQERQSNKAVSTRNTIL